MYVQFGFSNYNAHFHKLGFVLVPFLSHASDQIKVCHPISNESDAIARPNPMEILSHQVETQLDSATETDIRVSLNFGATWDQK